MSAKTSLESFFSNVSLLLIHPWTFFQNFTKGIFIKEKQARKVCKTKYMNIIQNETTTNAATCD